MLSPAIALVLAAAVAAQVASPPVKTAERAADNADKMICKKFLETGSLVRGYRTCKTKFEWERERDNIRSPQTTSGSCSSGSTGRCDGT